MKEWYRGKPIKRVGCKVKTTKRLLVCHLENNSKIYLYIKTSEKRDGVSCETELLNYSEAKKRSRIHRGYAIVISLQQFELIMAMFNNEKMLVQYLKDNNLFSKITGFEREYI